MRTSNPERDSTTYGLGRYAVLSAVLACSAGETQAAEPCTPWAAKIVSIEGRVEASRIGDPRWVTARLEQTFCPGDRVRIESRSRAAVLLANQTILRLDERTAITFTQVKPAEPSLLELLQGAIHFLSRTPAQLRINTPFSAAGVEGTEFVLRVTENATQLWVFEGRVRFANAQGSLMLASGEAAAAQAGRAPQRRVVVRPREAVQWALYYPPLIDYRLTSYPAGPDALGIKEALKFYRHDDLASAFASLDQVPDAARAASYYTLRAGLLLNVGRVDEARADLDRALKLDPKNATVYSLQSVILMVQNEQEQALYLARKGEELDPQSPIPKVALSYAYQAKFDLENALQNIEQALALAPTDALAYARLAELQLSRGELERAVNAAKTAVALDPDVARTQTVLGFAYLTEIHIDRAKATFQKAIELDPSSPLPRLGLGLAKIRDGDLKAGTQEIEIAASLDPNNSLVRSYLGKAYYEEKRGGLASSEFEIAKQLDPKDPTPWFYDAIQKQTTNRPVEALHDLQKSIELNDNRAVYRSKLLLDEDLAARSASLGRIYNDLGFQQLGLVEGWQSVNTDPSNYSAHRLLADNYAALPRHEIARVSELLQSQLLQPLNVTPVQPNLAESNLLILEGGGPSAPSFNEFNPLFTRNRFALQAAGVLGDHDTLGDEVTQSGLWDKFSYSLGQFHFQTDGFQENNDLQHDIYSAFGQWTATPETNVQVELRRRETESGKVALTFDPLDPDFRQELDQNSARAGLHLQPALNQNTLLSFAYQSTEIVTSNLTPFEPPFESDFGRERTQDKTDTYHFELQHLYTTRGFNAIAGMGYVDGDFDRAVLRDLIINGQAIVPEGRPLTRVDDTVDTSHLNAYVYLPFRLTPNMLVTLGLSYDDIEDVDINTSQINPKFGLIWNAFTNTTLRAAAFRVMKRQFGSNQTIEPTQVAGFNQFFDESDGTDSTRYGVGMDHRLTDSLATGLELSWRKADFVRLLEPDLTVPRSLAEFDATDHEQDEVFHRAYAYWTPIGSLALGVQYQYESFDRKEIGFAVGDPDELITHYVPLTVKYFHPSGFFAAFGATYADQGLEFDIFGEGGKIGERDEGDNFWVLDSSVGFRFPKRYGLLTLEMQNLTDEDFRFQSFFNPEELRTPRFQPERAIFATLSLSFP